MSEISKLIEPNNPALRVRLNEVTEKCDREKNSKRFDRFYGTLSRYRSIC